MDLKKKWSDKPTYRWGIWGLNPTSQMFETKFLGLPTSSIFLLWGSLDDFGCFGDGENFRY